MKNQTMEDDYKPTKETVFYVIGLVVVLALHFLLASQLPIEALSS